MKKYLSFYGNSSRTEFWAINIVGYTLIFVTLVAAMLSIETEEAVHITMSWLVALVTFIATIWAELAVTARRCRDAGISPVWTISIFLPYVGFIAWIVIGVLPTHHQEGIVGNVN